MTPAQKQPYTAAKLESPLSISFIFLALIGLDALLASRYRVVPVWISYLLAFVAIGSIFVRKIDRGSPAARKAERVVLSVATTIAILLNTANLSRLVYQIVNSTKHLEARPLLYSAIAIWITNLLTFTMLYWLLDRGGPDARASANPRHPDFDFPTMSDPANAPPGWYPTIVDYLFIGFTTNTAFSPTEAMPLTRRAKWLVMTQSAISLVTIIVLAARAIGIVD